VLDDPDVSGEHAVLFFDGYRWLVRDLSSRNGTLVDGKRVEDVLALRQAAVIRFGGSANEWQLLDADPPSSRAVSLATGQVVVGSTVLVLPDATRCEAYISKQSGQWFVERAGESRSLALGAQLALSDGLWALELASGDDRQVAETAALDENETTLEFKVSRDEERVQLSIVCGPQVRTLAHRSHLYLLVILARRRAHEQSSVEVSPSDHGWMETKELAKMLGTTSEQVNVWVWRAREQMQAIDSELAQRIVERRPSSGQLRIGFSGLVLGTL
jgi:hypothetical protein